MKKVLKLGIISQYFWPEQGTVISRAMAKRLIQQGADVNVLTSFPAYPGGRIYAEYKQTWTQFQTVDEIKIRRSPQYPSHDTNAAKRILTYLSFAITSGVQSRWLADRDVNYVYCPPPTAALAALLLKKRHGIPYVLHVQDLWPESLLNSEMLPFGFARPITWLVRASMKLIYRNAAAIVTISNGFCADIESFGVPRERIHVVRNWTNEDYFSVGNDGTISPVAKQISDQLSFVYAGNIGPNQDLETFIEVANMASSLPCSFYIVGSGISAETLKSKHRNGSNVTFVDRQPFAVMKTINFATAVMVISLKELSSLMSTIPGKTQVALASGKPIWAIAAGELAQLVAESGAGFASRPGDVREGLKVVEKFVTMSENERQELGEAGREYYESSLSMEVGISELFRVLSEVAR
jgi:colanic acid biosynthesis glycosyl transferase WcaI